jgi:hypothetical protein
MKISIRIFAILAFVSPAFSLLSKAQSNFKPGYIVNLKGDTLKGSIDYKEWEKNPALVTFKNASGASQVYTAQNANAFGVNGLEFYEKYIVNVSQDQVDATKAGGVIDTAYARDTIFLHTLAKGRYLSLYSYQDAIKTRYYVLEIGSTQPQELVYHVYVDANGNIQYVNRYRGQLQYIAQKNNLSNAKLAVTLSQLDYSEHDMLKAAAAINGNDPSQYISKSQFGTRLFAGAGVSYTDMVFTGIIQYGDSYALFPRIDAGIDFLTNKNTKRLFLRLEVAATGDQHTFTNTYEQSQLKVTQYTASLIPQAYYNLYNGQKLRIFVGGGLLVNFSTYPTRYYTSETGVDLTPTEQNKFPDYHTLWESFMLKAGVTLSDRVEIYAGYMPVTTITNNYEEFAGNVIWYQAGVNFLFGGK